MGSSSGSSCGVEVQIQQSTLNPSKYGRLYYTSSDKLQCSPVYGEMLEVQGVVPDLFLTSPLSIVQICV